WCARTSRWRAWSRPSLLVPRRARALPWRSQRAWPASVRGDPCWLSSSECDRALRAIRTGVGSARPVVFEHLDGVVDGNRGREHGGHGAVLLARQLHRLGDRVGIEMMAAYDVAQADAREHGGRTDALLGFDAHLISGHVLALLAQDRDHVERRAGGERE